MPYITASTWRRQRTLCLVNNQVKVGNMPCGGNTNTESGALGERGSGDSEEIFISRQRGAYHLIIIPSA